MMELSFSFSFAVWLVLTPWYWALYSEVKVFFFYSSRTAVLQIPHSGKHFTLSVVVCSIPEGPWYGRFLEQRTLV